MKQAEKITIGRYKPRLFGKNAWCCLGLEHAFGQRNERNIFVFATPPNEFFAEPTFWIAMRAADEDAVKGRTFESFPENSLIVLATKLPISYCPWCGATLSKYYRKSYHKLIDDKVAKQFGIDIP